MKKKFVIAVAIQLFVGWILCADEPKPTAANPAEQFVAVSVCRVLDTRSMPPASPAEETARRIDIASSPCARDIPSTALRYSLRVTRYGRGEVARSGDFAGTFRSVDHAEGTAGAMATLAVPPDANITVDVDGYYLPPSARPGGTAAQAASPAPAAATGQVPRRVVPLDSGDLVQPGNVFVGATPYNGGLYSANDLNWGFAIAHPASPADDYEVRLNYVPNTGGNRKAGIYNINSNSYSLYSDSKTNPDIVIPAGNLGVGTASPGDKLEVNGGIKISDPAGTYTGMVYAGDRNWGFSVTHPATPADDYETRLVYFPNAGGNRKAGIYNNVPPGSYVLYADSNTTPNVIIPSGSLGIGTTTPGANLKLDVNGNANISGSLTANAVINAVYGQDVAEWVRGDRQFAPGTVVVLNPEKSNEVMPSMQAYDTTVAGVVSAQPGLVLGRPGALKATVATSGRVRVRVDARKGAIRIGDLLVTSDEPGTAMKSQPIDIGGQKFHRPGTIVGKALEPLPNGVGEILVLLCLG
jgi:hypothetical protein